MNAFQESLCKYVSISKQKHLPLPITTSCFPHTSYKVLRLSMIWPLGWIAPRNSISQIVGWSKTGNQGRWCLQSHCLWSWWLWAHSNNWQQLGWVYQHFLWESSNESQGLINPCKQQVSQIGFIPLHHTSIEIIYQFVSKYFRKLQFVICLVSFSVSKINTYTN